MCIIISKKAKKAHAVLQKLAARRSIKNGYANLLIFRSKGFEVMLQGNYPWRQGRSTCPTCPTSA
jgi:hypothetical protein